MFTFKKGIKNFEVQVDVQKGPQGLKGKLTMDALFSYNSHFHAMLSYGNSP